MQIKEEYRFEIDLETRLRKITGLIPLITLLTGIIIYAGIGFCLYLYNHHYYWSILPAGLLAHSFFIVIIHDAAHKAITRTKTDRLLMNLGSAFMLLPFYGEPFRKYHLIHHANTNSEEDPLWTTAKKNLYENKRIFYVFCELVPLLFTLYLITRPAPIKNRDEAKPETKGPKINFFYIFLATLFSIGIFFIITPPLWFFLGTLLVLNVFSALRHWCEHLGLDKTKSSNTFWFPLGMGIGNHDTHHQLPNISWFVLSIGLFYRKKDTNPLKTLMGVIFNKSFIHYEG